MGIHLNLEDRELAIVGYRGYVAGGFYSGIESLRTECWQPLGQEGQHAGRTPLTCALREKMYCFLATGAEKVF